MYFVTILDYIAMSTLLLLPAYITKIVTYALLIEHERLR